MTRFNDGANIIINNSTNVKWVIAMNKKELLDKMTEKNNGYLFVSEVEKENISRTYLAEYVHSNNFERVAKGIYISEDTGEDELFIMQRCYPNIIFSGETALYLHQLIDREYNKIYVSVPRGFSGSRLRKKGVEIHQEKEETYNLGIVEIETNFGNKIRCYDRERCICDLVKNRKKTEVQNYQTALVSYLRDKDRELSKLMRYAKLLKIEDEMKKYVEVLV